MRYNLTEQQVTITGKSNLMFQHDSHIGKHIIVIFKLDIFIFNRSGLVLHMVD